MGVNYAAASCVGDITSAANRQEAAFIGLSAFFYGWAGWAQPTSHALSFCSTLHVDDRKLAGCRPMATVAIPARLQYRRYFHRRLGLMTTASSFLAKTAVIDTISAFGAAEFALATFSRTLLARPVAAMLRALLAGWAHCVNVPGGAPPRNIAPTMDISYWNVRRDPAV